MKLTIVAFGLFGLFAGPKIESVVCRNTRECLVRLDKAARNGATVYVKVKTGTVHPIQIKKGTRDVFFILPGGLDYESASLTR